MTRVRRRPEREARIGRARPRALLFRGSGRRPDAGASPRGVREGLGAHGLPGLIAPALPGFCRLRGLMPFTVPCRRSHRDTSSPRFYSSNSKNSRHYRRRHRDRACGYRFRRKCAIKAFVACDLLMHGADLARNEGDVIHACREPRGRSARTASPIGRVRDVLVSKAVRRPLELFTFAQELCVSVVLSAASVLLTGRFSSHDEPVRLRTGMYRDF